MKIIIASLLPPGNYSGSQKFIELLYTELKVNKVDVYLVNRQFKLQLINWIVRFPGRILFHLSGKCIWLVWDLVYSTIVVWLKIIVIGFQLKEVDIIHAQDIFSGYAALKLKWLFNYRVLLTVHFNHAVSSEFYENGLIKKDGFWYKRVDNLEKSILKRVAYVVFVSGYMRKYVLKKYSIKNNCVIYNGTDSNKDKKIKLIAKGKKILLNIGTLEKRKNQVFLLQVYSKLLEVDPDYELLFIGTGKDLATLKEIMDKKNLASNVRFLGKVDNVQFYLTQTFLYLHAALMENFSIALLEAQSFGIPIIAPPVGGIPELVKDGYNGFLLKTDKKNICNWVSTIEKIAKDKSLYLELCKNSKLLFDGNFTKDIMIDKYIDLYTRI